MAAFKRASLLYESSAAEMSSQLQRLFNKYDEISIWFGAVYVALVRIPSKNHVYPSCFHIFLSLPDGSRIGCSHHIIEWTAKIPAYLHNSIFVGCQRSIHIHVSLYRRWARFMLHNESLLGIHDSSAGHFRSNKQPSHRAHANLAAIVDETPEIGQRFAKNCLVLHIRPHFACDIIIQQQFHRRRASDMVLFDRDASGNLVFIRLEASLTNWAGANAVESWRSIEGRRTTIASGFHYRQKCCRPIRVVPSIVAPSVCHAFDSSTLESNGRQMAGAARHRRLARHGRTSLGS